MLNNKFLPPLVESLQGNLARLKCVSFLISAILRHRTVNLVILATSNDGRNCSHQSRYRRFQDFFKNFRLNPASVAKFVLQPIPRPRQGYVLAMDRTNWEFGGTSINLLVVAIVTGPVSIPVFWTALPKKSRGGNSNCKQRISLVRNLLAVLPAHDILALTMDREFVGKQWLQWLDGQGIGYVVRVKKNTSVGWRQAGEYASLPGRRGAKPVEIFGLPHYFASKRMKRGGSTTRLMVVSNRFQGSGALKLYRMRWGIERLFGHLKKQGFDLEATHMTTPYKLETLFGLLALAFLFGFAWGCRLRVSGEQDSAASKRKSLFRLGMEDILALLDSGGHSVPQWHRHTQFIRWIQSVKFDSIFLV